MKTEWIQVRISAEEKGLFMVEAKKRGMNLSEFVLTCLHDYIGPVEGCGDIVLTDLKRGILGGKGGVLTDMGPVEDAKLDVHTKRLDGLLKKGMVKKGVKELPSQEVGEFKTYFKK